MLNSFFGACGFVVVWINVICVVRYLEAQMNHRGDCVIKVEKNCETDEIQGNEGWVGVCKKHWVSVCVCDRK